MAQPLVSVTMAVCNAERFLAEAIESVLVQTFRNLEFIIVDFGSSDSSKAIVLRYAAKDSRIKFHEIPNCGLAEARNAACSCANGQYIAVMDADDICLPDRLLLEVNFMESNPDISLIGGATEWIDQQGRSLGVHKVPCENLEIQAILPSRCPFWHPTVVIRTDAFLFVKGYRKSFVFAHDYDLELRVSEYFKCANLPQIVLKYRIHPSQVTFRKRELQTLCKLAAEVSAASRRSGRPDPLGLAADITPALLAELGVSEPALQNTLVSDSRNWIRGMLKAGEYLATLDAACAILRSNMRHVEGWQIADLHLTVALLYWKQGRFGASLIAAARALLTHPVAIKRPLSYLWSRVQPPRDSEARRRTDGNAGTIYQKQM